MAKVVEIADLYGKYERSGKIRFTDKLKSAWLALGKIQSSQKGLETREERKLRENEEDRTFKMNRSRQDKRLVNYLNNFTWKFSAAIFLAVLIALILLDSELEPGNHGRNSTKLRSNFLADKS